MKIYNLLQNLFDSLDNKLNEKIYLKSLSLRIFTPSKFNTVEHL